MVTKNIQDVQPGDIMFRGDGSRRGQVIDIERHTYSVMFTLIDLDDRFYFWAANADRVNVQEWQPSQAV